MTLHFLLLFKVVTLYDHRGSVNFHISAFPVYLNLYFHVVKCYLMLRKSIDRPKCKVYIEGKDE